MGGYVAQYFTARKQTVVHPAPVIFTLILFYKSRDMVTNWAPCMIRAEGSDFGFGGHGEGRATAAGP